MDAPPKPDNKKAYAEYMMKDLYACVDCEFEWRGEEQDCPRCQSTRTGLLVPADEDLH